MNFWKLWKLNALHTGTVITIVGSADNILYDKDRLVYTVEMKTAYLVSTTSVVSGKITQKSAKNGLPFCQIGGTAVFLPGDVLDTLQVGDAITAAGALTHDDTPFFGSPEAAPPEWDMKDAVLVEESMTWNGRLTESQPLFLALETLSPKASPFHLPLSLLFCYNNTKIDSKSYTI